MTARSWCRPGSERCYCNPPPPAAKNARSWRDFLLTVEVRIRQFRTSEPIDSRIESWQTFNPPLTDETSPILEGAS